MLNNNSAITNVWNTVIGSTGTLTIYTGSAPATCASGTTGTLLATISLSTPSSSTKPFGQASSGAIVLDGLTLSATAGAGSAATPGYFRINDSGATCHVQGTCAIGSGDLNFNGTITSGQTVSITGFTITAPGA